MRPRSSVDGDCASTWVAPAGVTVGALTFEGGFLLEGTRRDFGGLSGLEAIDARTLLALGDNGRVVAIELGEGADGVPLARCRVRALLDEGGAPLGEKADADAEGLALLAPDRIAVSFERDHRVAAFRLGESVRQDGAPSTFAVARRLEPNRGLEALALLPSGELAAGAENPTVLGSPQWVWRLAPPPAAGEPRGSFRIAGDVGYALVGLDATPGGGLVALERFYTRSLGVRTKISWLPPGVAESATGLVRATQLARLTGAEGLAVDNFEGVAALAGEDGRTVVWIVSDDNFSNGQRTLLYRFSFDEAALAGEAAS